MTHATQLREALLLGCLSIGSSTAFAQAIQPRMGEPLQGLTAAQYTRFTLGETVFNHALTPAEGLGPGFNDTACAGCHLAPNSGGSSSKFVTRFGKAASGGNPFDPLANLGGSLLQAESIVPGSCDEVVPPQADVTTHRITPPTFGYGLVEAIDDADIQVREFFPPPGVHGKAHLVVPLEDPPGSPARVGRFGWKSQVVTLLSFSGDASLNEMGLTNSLVGQENAPNGDLVELAMCDLVPDPEDHPDGQGVFMIERMRDFQRFLAPPPQTPRSGMQGEAIFNSIGCASCHVSSDFTASVAGEPGIAGKTLHPYSDFLLHDMGTLGDGIVQGQATEKQFRTSPLWGMHARDSIAMLHDGRANGGTVEQNIVSAINSHDGEGARSRTAFNMLSAGDQTLVANFLDSLGKAEFDYEGNNNVDEVDWFFLQPLLNGPTPAYTPDSVAAIADFDQDGDFDLKDFGVLQRAFTGP